MQPVVQIGPYLVERELARGGMGVVYVARHPEWNRRVALKLILDPEAGQEIVTRFQREGEALARIQHPNVVRVYSAGHHEGRPYLALGFVEGGSLAERIPLEPRAAAELFVPLAQALAAGHAVGVLHRDLKPANVLVDPAGVPYLTDYGLASDPEREQERLTRTGTVLGTPGYMAPEQAGGEVELLGEATDVYGLGATLYAALCGVPPFKGSTVINTINAVLRDAPRPPSAHVPDLPRDLETIVLRCLEKEPADRYPSADALAHDMERFLAGEPIEATRPSTRERLLRSLRRRPAPFATLAVLLVAGLLAIAVPVHRAARSYFAQASTPTQAPPPRSATPDSAPLSSTELAERLREHYLAQRYRELSELCDDYERRYPNLPALHRWRGQVQHLHERWEEARDSFTIAIESPGAKERAPRDYYAALRLRAETLRELRSRDGADERALDEQRLADLDEYLSGTADYARFLELHPDWEELAKRHDEDPRRVYEEQQIAARLERIKGLMRERRLKEIVREAEHLLAMAAIDSSTRLHCLRTLRDVLDALKRWDEALDYAQQLRETVERLGVEAPEPRTLTAKRELELIAQFLGPLGGNAARAREVCRWALAGPQPRPAELHALAQEVALHHQLDLAAELCAGALAAAKGPQPEWEEAAVGWLSTIGREQGLKPLQAALEVALQRAPRSFRLNLVACDIEVQQGQRSAAIARMSRVLDQLPADHYDRRSFLVMRANFLHQEGQLKAALVDYEDAAELDPGWNFALRFATAVCLRKLGRSEEAIDHLVAALRAKPRDDLAQDAVAELKKLGVEVDFKKR